MNSTSARVECVSSASELQDNARDLQLTMTTLLDMFADYSVDPATKYLVTFEMTIKPLPEEPFTSGNHPLTDGSER